MAAFLSLLNMMMKDRMNSIGPMMKPIIEVSRLWVFVFLEPWKFRDWD